MNEPESEIRSSLYQWFQIPPGYTLQKVHFIHWREERIPNQTGGAGLLQDNRNFPDFSIKLWNREIPESPESETILKIPCIKHPNSGHLCWVTCRCLSCNQDWSCVSFHWYPYCRRCRNNFEYTREQKGQVEIRKLFCGWELLIPETREVFKTDWYKVLGECAKRFAWKKAQRKIKYLKLLY